MVAKLIDLLCCGLWINFDWEKFFRHTRICVDVSVSWWLFLYDLCACFVALLMRVTLYSPSKSLLHVYYLMFTSKKDDCVQPVCSTIHYEIHVFSSQLQCLSYLKFSLWFCFLSPHTRFVFLCSFLIYNQRDIALTQTMSSFLPPL